jgi:cellulose synthase/poly-beta-1,6-N-acetylglucosamine synthase-like glycosyltransferase
MWIWWLNVHRIGFAPLYFPLTLALFYEFALLPTIFLYFLFRAKYPPKRRAQKGLKVAVISLCVPSSESLDIVERQLEAMAAITYPHDSWILDEGNSPEIKRMARKHGVNHFSRKGIAKYNQDVAPFKAKTKAGNVNAWLERVKRRKYDYFVQFDIDHLANPNYLDKTLGHFRDPQVAWVQAPSVYKNHDSWTARGSSEQELVLQGPLQMGFYGHSKTPFIIGSHCTYRTSAIREIGGFQPTRAEDHLDTVMMANRGYTGVFVPEIIAEGDGPESLDTYLGQQFAWAYSMFQVLTDHSPKLLGAMSWRKRFQFLFSQTWYPLWSLSYFITFIVPVVSLVLGREVAMLGGYDFVEHFIPLFACSFLVWWAGKPLMQPQHIGLTWRGMLLHVVRWPIVLKAVLAAAFKVKKPYMITPKGSLSYTLVSVKTYRPFLLLGLTSVTAVIYASAAFGSRALESQVVFALTNALFMVTICLLDLDLRIRDAGHSLLAFKEQWLKPLAATGTLAVALGLALVTSPLVYGHAIAAFTSEQQPATSKTVPLSKQSIAMLTSSIKRVPASTAPEPNIGIYNPHGVQVSSAPYIRHSFVDWRNQHRLAEQILITERAGNTPLITLEPRGELDGAALLQHIADGAYDSRLAQVSTVVAASNGPVYIRFAHEMELSGLYPWSSQDPALYIAAYRHVVDYVRSHGGTQARWVWSPAGNIGSLDYYPGDDVVDVIGTTVLYDQYWYPDFVPSFEDLVQDRMLLQGLGKPVWIAEFGAGRKDPAIQADLISQATSRYQEDGFAKLLYLNAADSNVAGPDYRLMTASSFSTIFAPVKTATPAVAKVPAHPTVVTKIREATLPQPVLPAPLRFSSHDLIH